jgi:xanthine dehydrogenase large subunit
MNGRAVEIACGMILDRLLAVAAQRLDTSAECVTIHDDAILLDGRATDLGWDQLVWHAYSQRISLTAQAHYATPGIWYDREREHGEPFAYHVFGTAVVEATVDCLRGTATIDRVRMVHDAGRPLNEVIDRGQAEGGLLQGIGWMTMEELLFDDGHNISNTLSTYKVPDLLATPEIEVVFLDDADNPKAVLRSKAIGEPPLMYGIGAYFAIKSAMQAFRRDLPLPFSAPLTSEKILSALYASGTGDPFPEHLPSPAAVVD